MPIAPRPPTWRTILQSARAGSLDALNRLFGGAWPFLVFLARQRLPAHLKAKMDAEDLAQLALLEVFKSFERFHGSRKKQWLVWLRIILNHNLENTLRDYRRQKRSTLKELLLDEGDSDIGAELAASEETPSGILQRAELLAHFDEAVAELPEGLWRVFDLHFSQSFSHREIARQLDLSENAVQKRWARVLRKLSRRMIG